MVNYRYSLQETTQPAVLPLSATEVKTYLRIDNDSDDALIENLIAAACKLCERSTGLSLINREISLYMDAWDNEILPLPSVPVVSVNAIKVYSSETSSSVYSASNYYVDNKNLYNPRIVLKEGPVIPLPGIDVNGIEIQYTAGFGASAEYVPALLKQGMLQVIAYLYEHRGDGENNALKNSGASAIFQSYRKASIVL